SPSRPLHGGQGPDSAALQLQIEGGPLTELALHHDVAFHRACQVPTDGEAETGAFANRAQCPAELDERLEDVIDFLSRDADAGVADGDVGVRPRDSARCRHTAAFVGELDRVRQKVEHYLLRLEPIRAR